MARRFSRVTGERDSRGTTLIIDRYWPLLIAGPEPTDHEALAKHPIVRDWKETEVTLVLTESLTAFPYCCC